MTVETSLASDDDNEDPSGLTEIEIVAIVKEVVTTLVEIERTWHHYASTHWSALSTVSSMTTNSNDSSSTSSSAPLSPIPTAPMRVVPYPRCGSSLRASKIVIDPSGNVHLRMKPAIPHHQKASLGMFPALHSHSHFAMIAQIARPNRTSQCVLAIT
jgi:hypothetical protein